MSLDGFHSSANPDATAARLLQAACELVGGEEQLARRLQTSPVLLRRYMGGHTELPQRLLLSTVDLLLEERESLSRRAEDAHGAAGGS